MGSENRIQGLKDAVLRFHEIATAVNSKAGLTLCCFDNPNLTGLDNITSKETLRQKLDEIQFNTGYGVPTPLMEKILKPLAYKAQKRQLESPIIVVVITDGGVSNLFLTFILFYLRDATCLCTSDNRLALKKRQLWQIISRLLRPASEKTTTRGPPCRSSSAELALTLLRTCSWDS